MKLTGKIVGVLSASGFTDEKRRLQIRFAEADYIDSRITLADDGQELKLDDTVLLTDHPVPAISVPEALKLLAAAYPTATFAINETAWENYHDHYSPPARHRRVEWNVSVLTNDACDRYEGKTLSEALDKALVAATKPAPVALAAPPAEPVLVPVAEVLEAMRQP